MHFLRTILALLLLLASPALAQVNPGTSPLTGSKGGTNNAFMQFSGPATSIKTYALPNASDTISTLAAVQTFTAAKTFNDMTLILAGSSSGTTTLKASAAASGVLTLPAVTDTIVARTTTDTLTNKTMTAPTINGGTVAALTSFGIRSSGTGAFDLQFNNTENLTASRAITFTIHDASRVFDLSGGVTIGTGGFATAGGSSIVLNSTGPTSVTLPTTGTLATLAGSETLTNKTFNCVNNTCTVRIGSDVSGLGAGVASALSVAVNGSAGLVTFNGALGTPTSGTATNLTGLPISTGLTGAGTGVITALGVNVGSPGAVVVNGGALGTPSSGTLTSATGLPISTGVSGLGTGVAAALGTTLNTTSGLCTYQQGTWTPSFTGSSTAGTGQTYSLGPVGSYETCGRAVIARFTMQASSLGTAAGNLQISGLPFTSSATSNDYGTCFIAVYAVTGLAASSFGVSGFITPSATLATLLSHSNTGTTAITIAQAGASVEMIGTCFYHT